VMEQVPKMSPSKLISFRSPRHRLYTPPTLTRMTGEQAEAVLGAKAIPSDEEGAQLLRAIKSKAREPWQADPTMAKFKDGSRSHHFCCLRGSLVLLHCAACSCR
jgi:hypothetical protein